MILRQKILILYLLLENSTTRTTIVNMAPNFEETITKFRGLEEQKIRHSKLQLGLITIFQETGNFVFYILSCFDPSLSKGYIM